MLNTKHSSLDCIFVAFKGSTILDFYVRRISISYPIFHSLIHIITYYSHSLMIPINYTSLQEYCLFLFQKMKKVRNFWNVLYLGFVVGLTSAMLLLSISRCAYICLFWSIHIRSRFGLDTSVTSSMASYYDGKLCAYFNRILTLNERYYSFQNFKYRVSKKRF